MERLLCYRYHSFYEISLTPACKVRIKKNKSKTLNFNLQASPKVISPFNSGKNYLTL